MQQYFAERCDCSEAPCLNLHEQECILCLIAQQGILWELQEDAVQCPFEGVLPASALSGFCISNFKDAASGYGTSCSCRTAWREGGHYWTAGAGACRLLRGAVRGGHRCAGRAGAQYITVALSPTLRPSSLARQPWPGADVTCNDCFFAPLLGAQMSFDLCQMPTRAVFNETVVICISLSDLFQLQTCSSVALSLRPLSGRN